MGKRKFWNWVRDSDTGERTLVLNGTIAEESWFGDEVTPAIFRDELTKGEGDITVWINSCGGDVYAAAQIYNMLMDYKGKVTVRIDGIAASAASMVAMAGEPVEMSPVGMFMIHNPATVAIGDKKEMQAAIEMLGEVKEGIINAYELKTGFPMMCCPTTWMPKRGSMQRKPWNLALWTRYFSPTMKRKKRWRLWREWFFPREPSPIHSSIKSRRNRNGMYSL